jgi:hypothetical protein
MNVAAVNLLHLAEDDGKIGEMLGRVLPHGGHGKMESAMDQGLRTPTDKRLDAPNSSPGERSLQVVEQPIIKGPFKVQGDPSIAAYEIVAQLSLPAPDTEVVPEVSYCETPEAGTCLDIRWRTTDEREPQGVWERSAVIMLPRQFGIGTYQLTADPPLMEREVGA